MFIAMAVPTDSYVRCTAVKAKVRPPLHVSALESTLTMIGQQTTRLADDVQSEEVLLFVVLTKEEKSSGREVNVRLQKQQWAKRSVERAADTSIVW